MKRFLLLLLCGFCLGLFCIPRPKHTNPYDPKTPNAPPQQLDLPPDSLVRSVTNAEIELEWRLVHDQDVDDFEAYNIWRARDVGSPPSAANMPPPVARITSYVNTSHVDRGLDSNTAYLYAVTVEDKGGLQSQPVWTRVRTAPRIARGGELHRELAAVNHMFLRTATDSITIFGLGKKDNGANAMSYVIMPVGILGNSPPQIVNNLDMLVTDPVIPPVPSLNGATPLENSIYKYILTQFMPDRFDTTGIPPGPTRDSTIQAIMQDAKSPLDTDIENELVWEYELSLDAGAADKDTVFLAFSFYVKHNYKRLNDTASIKYGSAKDGQIGMIGILVTTLGEHSLDPHSSMLPLTSPAMMPEIAPDAGFVSFGLSAAKTELFAAVVGPGNPVLTVNRSTGITQVVTSGQIDGIDDPQEMVLFAKSVGGVEYVYIGGGSGITRVNTQTKVQERRVMGKRTLFDGIQSIYVDNNENIYVLDDANAGLSVVDTTKTIVSRWTSSGFGKEFDFGPSDRVLGLGNQVVFTTDAGTIWRAMP